MSCADPYYACLYTGKKIALRKKMELVTEFKDVSVFRAEELVLFTCVWIICLSLNSLYIVNFFPVLKKFVKYKIFKYVDFLYFHNRHISQNYGYSVHGHRASGIYVSPHMAHGLVLLQPFLSMVFWLQVSARKILMLAYS